MLVQNNCYFLGNFSKSEDVWSITEWSGSFGLHKPPCREGDQKSAKKDSNCEKINSETKRGSAAKNYQGIWTSKARRVKGLCSLWPFHSIFFQLEGTILNSLSWKLFFNWSENLNSMCGYAQREGENQKDSYAKCMRKNKGCFFPKHDLKKWFWSTKSMISSNMTYFFGENQQSSVLISKFLAIQFSNSWNIIH